MALYLLTYDDLKNSKFTGVEIIKENEQNNDEKTESATVAEKTETTYQHLFDKSVLEYRKKELEGLLFDKFDDTYKRFFERKRNYAIHS